MQAVKQQEAASAISIFERYLTLWVALRILAGLALVAMGVILLQTPPPPFAPMPVS